MDSNIVCNTLDSAMDDGIELNFAAPSAGGYAGAKKKGGRWTDR
jgi:hypothetical protein